MTNPEALQAFDAPAARPLVYGADWCEDTQRALRLLRRLSIAHRYINVDEDAAALERAVALNGGQRRTPVIDIAGTILVEPSNPALAEALVTAELIGEDDVSDRLAIQNVGDTERAARAVGGALLVAAAQSTPAALRWPLRIAGAALSVTGITGWCPVYRTAGVTSLDGPGDRPHEATRVEWLTYVRGSRT